MGRRKKNIVKLIPCACGICSEWVPNFDKWGKTRRFAYGHANLGRIFSEEHRKNISKTRIGTPSTFKGKKHTEVAKKKVSEANKGRKMSEEFRRNKAEIMREKWKGELNPNWQGDNIGYKGIHIRMRKFVPKPESCQICRLVPPRELSNKTGKYLLEISDWQWLCSKCHKIYDNIMERNFKKRWERNKKFTNHQNLEAFGV